MAGVLKTVTPDGRGDGHFLIGAYDPNMSAEQIILKANAGDLEAGTVLGKVTATGQYALHDPAAADGTELVNSTVILWGRRANSAATQKAVAVARHATANANALTHKAGATTNQKNAAIAGLATRNIICRS
jgi:hypothetical protein